METFKNKGSGSAHPSSSVSSSHPSYYRRHELPIELEDGELQTRGGGNPYLSQQHQHDKIPFTRQENSGGISDIKKPHMIPFTGMRDNVTNTQRDTQGKRQLSAPGHYCHLSYYGEEVDKDYLPDLATDRYPVDNQVHYEYKPHVVHMGFGTSYQNHQGNHDFFPLHLPQSQINPGHFATSNKAGIGRRHGHHFAHPSYQQPTSMQQGHDQNHVAFNLHCPNMVVNVKQDIGESFTPPSPPESFNSFETAATSFQEKQAEQNTINSANNGVKPIPGWSRVTSNAPIKRKVTFLDDEDHETKLQERLNRFGKPMQHHKMSRQKAADLSLDEIIKRKQERNGFTTRGGRATPSPYPHQARSHFSSSRHASMWLSGDGKSFSDPVIAFRPDNRVHYRNSFDSTDYGNQKCFRNDEQPRFRERRHIKAKRKFDRYPETTETFTDNNVLLGRAIPPFRFLPIVVDGTSVAFTFGEDLHFACEGIRICVNYFLQLGYTDITVIVPRDRLRRGACKDGKILHDLRKREMLLVNWTGQFAGNGNDGDDRLFILDVARFRQAIIISNASFTEVANINPDLHLSMWNKVVNFHFSSATPKQIIFPGIDSSGMYGPTWEDVFHL